MEKGENMVALVGFLMIIAIVVLLLKGKMSPIVVLAVVQTAAGFFPPGFRCEASEDESAD